MTDRPDPDPAARSTGPRAARPAPATRAAAIARRRPVRAVAAGAAVALAGGAFYALLSQVDVGIGLLAVAAFIGWSVAVAMLWNASPGPFPRRGAVAAALGAGSIVLGLLLAWAWARIEGGVLGPLEYVDQRFGPVAYLEVVAAGVVAWLRAR